MRVQTSLEFILILSIISILCLTMVVSYKNGISATTHSFNGVLAANPLQASNDTFQIRQIPNIFFSIPSNSTTYKPSQLELTAFGCSNGTIDMHFFSPTIDFSQNSSQISVANLSFSEIYFTPLQSGYNRIQVSYNYSCDNNVRNSLINLTTYSSTPIIQYSNSQASAYIWNRSESFLYKILPAVNISGIKEFSHCTYSGPSGPPGENAQCGANSWGYSVFSDYCYTESNFYTMTYCMVPVSTGYNLSSINPTNYTLSYSFNLGLYYNNMNLTSGLSNNSIAPLVLSGNDVGSARVISASGIDSVSNPDFIGSEAGNYTANQSAYSQYMQAKNNLYSTLSFYNGSFVSTDTQSSIESAVAAYTSATKNLINSTTTSSNGCTFSNSVYKCKSPYPLSYQIDLTSNGLNIGNQTTSYLGSIFNIRSG
ncbi:MAG: hypothetical protein ACREBF_04370 [Candidatus Micrarchaeales archaeon]